MKLNILFCMLALLLGACNSSRIADPSIISGQVRGFPSGEFTIEALATKVNPLNPPSIGKASLSADKSLSVQLRKSLPDNFLFFEEVLKDLLEACSNASEEVRVLILEGLYVTKNQTIQGILIQGSSKTAINSAMRYDVTPRIGDKIALRVYADSDKPFSGTCNKGSPKLELNFKLATGWNTLVAEMKNAQTITLTTASSLEGLDWYYFTIDETRGL